MSTNKTQSPQVAEFSTGAKRGTDHADCDISLLPPEAVRAWGRAFAEGREKYGTHNWLKGFPQCGVINHALQHLYSYLEGDKSEDHLGHAMWNIGVAIHQQKYRPDMIDLPPYMQTLVSNEVINELHGPGGEIDLREHGPGVYVAPAGAKSPQDFVTDVYPQADWYHPEGKSDKYAIDKDCTQPRFNWISDVCETVEEAWQSALNRIHQSQSGSSAANASNSISTPTPLPSNSLQPHMAAHPPAAIRAGEPCCGEINEPRCADI